MTTLREAVAQALDALTKIHPGNMSWETGDAWMNAVQILREALAHPAPEPVAWMVYTLDGASVCVTDNPTDFGPEHKALPLYTSPPQHQEANPVVWQFRMRPDWVLDKDFWGPWTNCTKEQAADYQRVPHLHDWKYEVRLLYTAPPQRKPLTDDDLEPLRIRIMGEAYNVADEGQSEEYNAIKVLCAVLLDLVKRAVTSLDTADSKEAQLDYIAQQIKNVVSSFNISKSLPVADTESDVLTATYMLGVHAGKRATNRQPLTDEEITKLTADTWGSASIAPQSAPAFARAIEKAHGIGGDE